MLKNARNLVPQGRRVAVRQKDEDIGQQLMRNLDMNQQSARIWTHAQNRTRTDNRSGIFWKFSCKIPYHGWISELSPPCTSRNGNAWMERDFLQTMMWFEPWLKNIFFQEALESLYEKKIVKYLECCYNKYVMDEVDKPTLIFLYLLIPFGLFNFNFDSYAPRGTFEWIKKLLRQQHH